MAGMMPQEAPPQNMAQGGMQPAPDDGTVQATPEEEALAGEIVAQAQMLVYAKDTFPDILDMLDEEDGKEALARTASMVVLRVLTSAKEAGKEFPGDVQFAAATQIFEDLADVSQKFGYVDLEEPDVFDGAFYLMMDTLRVEGMQAGLIDQEAAMADFQAMAAEEQGQQPAQPQGMMPQGAV